MLTSLELNAEMLAASQSLEALEAQRASYNKYTPAVEVAIVDAAIEKKRKGRGGAREGAGRPADPSVRVMIRMKPRLHDRIKEQAKAEGQTIPEWIRQAAEDKLNDVQN